MVRFLALRGLFRHPARTLLGVLGVGVAGALLFDMQMLSRGLQASLHGILREVGYEVRVTPRGTLPFDTDATFADGHRIATAIESHPEVDHAAPILGGAVYAARAGATAVAASPIPAFVYGMDPPTEALWRVVRGGGLAPDDSTNAVVSTALAEALGVGVGDTLYAAGEYVAQLGMLRAPRSYRVVGVAEFHFDLRSQRTFAVGTREAQRLRNEVERDGLSLIAVALRNPDSTDVPGSHRAPDAGEDVAAWIRATFPDVEAYSVSEALEAVQGQLSYFNVFSLVLGTVSMVVCVLLVGTIVALSVGERLGELAILRAIGLRRRRLVVLVFAESVLLVALSLPIAFGAGQLIALWLDTILTRAPSIPIDMSFFVLTQRAVVRTLVLLFAAGAVAGLYPAVLVSRMRIAPTLHREVVG